MANPVEGTMEMERCVHAFMWTGVHACLSSAETGDGKTMRQTSMFQLFPLHYRTWFKLKTDSPTHPPSLHHAPLHPAKSISLSPSFTLHLQTNGHTGSNVLRAQKHGSKERQNSEPQKRTDGGKSVTKTAITCLSYIIIYCMYAYSKEEYNWNRLHITHSI